MTNYHFVQEKNNIIFCAFVNKNVKRGRGRPKLIWNESVKSDFKVEISLKR